MNKQWDDLAAAIDVCGYFPELVKDSMALALGEDALVEWFVQQEAIVARDSVQRHMSVLALTPSHLIVGHVDETDQPGPFGRPIARGQAAATTEAVPLSSINAVALTRVVDDPAHNRGIAETWLTLGWGVMRQLDLVPASCADPDCMADHGYSGTLGSDDMTLRVSVQADGADVVERLIRFGSALQRATGRR